MALETILTENFGFNEADLQRTRELFIPETLKAREHFVEEGKIATRLGIVVSGLFRTYYINRDADDITTAFHEPGSLLLSIDSFNNRVKSKENIMALTARERYEKFYRKHPQVLQKATLGQIASYLGDIATLSRIRKKITF